MSLSLHVNPPLRQSILIMNIYIYTLYIYIFTYNTVAKFRGIDIALLKDVAILRFPPMNGATKPRLI